MAVQITSNQASTAIGKISAWGHTPSFASIDKINILLFCSVVFIENVPP